MRLKVVSTFIKFLVRINHDRLAAVRSIEDVKITVVVRFQQNTDAITLAKDASRIRAYRESE